MQDCKIVRNSLQEKENDKEIKKKLKRNAFQSAKFVGSNFIELQSTVVFNKMMFHGVCSQFCNSFGFQSLFSVRLKDPSRVLATVDSM